MRRDHEEISKQGERACGWGRVENRGGSRESWGRRMSMIKNKPKVKTNKNHAHVWNHKELIKICNSLHKELGGALQFLSGASGPVYHVTL